ncbi:DUF362 domain-containing protein [Thermodesulfobacteriota bacterium]
MVKVSVVRCDNYNEKLLIEKILKSLETFGGIEKFVKPGDKVLLKPNLLSAKPAASCITTNPYFTKVCAQIFKDYGCRTSVGDSPPVQSSTKVAKKSGLLDELKKIDVPLIEFKDPVKLPIHKNALFKDIYIAKEVMEADHIINLPKIKSHTQMTITACVKNIFGVVVGKEKPMWHLKAGTDKEYFSHMLLDLYCSVSPTLTIADMIMVMEGNGPSSGRPKEVGAILTGTDCVAMDRVICDILDIPLELAYMLNEAKKFSDLESDLNNIEIISDGLDEIIKKAKGFMLPRKTEVDFGLPPFLKRLLREHLTSKPIIDKNLCRFCKACEDICPANVITIEGEEISFDYDKCIECFCCQEMCSFNALKVKQGILLKMINHYK